MSKQQATLSKLRSTLSKQHSTLLPQTATMSNDSIVKFRPFDKVETNWTCLICFDFVERTKFRSTLLPKPATLLPKTATMSTQHPTLSKERSTCSVRQCCFDIVASMDGALDEHGWRVGWWWWWRAVSTARRRWDTAFVRRLAGLRLRACPTRHCTSSIVGCRGAATSRSQDFAVPRRRAKVRSHRPSRQS